jgi:hypothetical protein
METIQIKDWNHFSSIAEKLSSLGTEGPNVFRGQENAEWPLRPSLTRLLFEQGVDKTRGLELEKKALREFQRKHTLLRNFAVIYREMTFYLGGKSCNITVLQPAY